MLCHVMQVHRSSYYSWLNRGESRTCRTNKKMAQIVQSTHDFSRGSYGARRHADELTSQGFACGRARAKTVMSLAGFQAKQKKKYKATTDSNHNLKVFPNALQREFSASRPNEVWVSDLTYIRTSAGWLYLAVVLDLFNREVVGWSMSERINRHLVINATRLAIWRKKPEKGLIFHSDRGSQYCSNDFTSYIAGHGLVGSMSRKGDCWDNAVAESFFASLKKERIHSASYKTREQAKSNIIYYIAMYYNSFRRHSYLGNVCPKEFLDNWMQQKRVA